MIDIKKSTIEKKICFSLLMSIYKNTLEAELNQCLNSISNQSLLPDEVVIVKDGPVDENLLTSIHKYNRLLNIKICNIEKNVGLGKALNIGLVNCKYDLVARIDSDDKCAPNRFEIQIPFMSEHHECDVLGSYIQYFKGNSIIGKRKVPLTSFDIKKFAWLRNPVSHPSVVIRKEKIMKLGGYPEVRFSQDYLLWLNCIHAGYNILNIPQYLVYMRKGSAFNRRRGLAMLYFDNYPYIYQYKKNMIGLIRFFIAVSVRTSYQLYNNIFYWLHKICSFHG